MPAVDLADARRDRRANSFEAVAKLFIERHRKQRNRASTIADGESCFGALSIHVGATSRSPRYAAVA